MLARALHVKAAANGSQLAATRSAQYDGAALHAAEVERDAKRQAQLALNRRKFIDGPVLTLTFRKMNVQFDPRNLQPLGDAGTVYPTIRISDEWGVIEGKNGALMKPDWSALVVVGAASVDHRQYRDGRRMDAHAQARMEDRPRCARRRPEARVAGLTAARGAQFAR